MRTRNIQLKRSKIWEPGGGNQSRSSNKFFSDLPAGKTQEVGIKSVIGNWAKQDPLSAGEWLNERPAGPELDSALSVYASTVANENAGAAMEWAISISQEKLQQQTIRKVGQEWYRQDKEAVEEWLPESGLSEDLMNKIRKPPKKIGGSSYLLKSATREVFLF